MELRQAQRKQAKIKLALQGPSGSGKTLSSLLLASGMTNYSKIAVIEPASKRDKLAFSKLQIAARFCCETPLDSRNSLILLPIFF